MKCCFETLNGLSETRFQYSLNHSLFVFSFKEFKSILKPYKIIKILFCYLQVGRHNRCQGSGRQQGCGASPDGSLPETERRPAQVVGQDHPQGPQARARTRHHPEPGKLLSL